ncbi:MAG: hypothetical protein HY519_01780, partial [Candidatus Aenigmarchaeota archaeon]|nr:hypothetical protein [Candidatus Aenigmarchaeota archaeon]
MLPLSGAELAPTACFDHYKYGTEAFSDFAPEKAEYAAGDAVNVRFKITNNFEIPLVDGNVKAVVVYKGEKDASNQLGDEIVDEFFMDHPVNLQPGAAMGGKITWTSPVGLRPGVYAINAYLMQTGKFNLKGLAFSTWSPGATTTFSMAGSGSPAYFDKAGITVNDGAYSERDIAPFFPP